MQQEKPRTIFFTDRLNDKDIGRWRTSGKDDGGAMMADFIFYSGDPLFVSFEIKTTQK
jgi:hypothetical protein